MKNGLTILILMLLAGCDQTVFESLPGKNTQSCDERLVGNWKILSAEDESSPKEHQEADDVRNFLVVKKKCQSFQVIENGEIKEEDEDLKELKPIFAKVGKKNLIVMPFSKEEQETKEKLAKRGYTYLAYEIKKDKVFIFDINHEHISELIKKGDLKGEIKHSGKEIKVTTNFLYGTPRVMEKIIKNKFLFSEEPITVMKKIDHLPDFSLKSKIE